MAKCIIWCRTSTDKQEWDTQKADLTKQAHEDGFDYDDIIPIGEKGASAIKMNELYQQEVNQLLDTINNTPEITTVYVWEISRLARNKVAFQQMEEFLMKKKIQFVCNVPNLRLLDDDGEINNGVELTFDLLITLAKQEMDIKKKRFARGKERLAKEGKYNGGNIPYGYKIDKNNDNKIVVDDDEATVIREIFNLYERGLSQPKIAKELSQRGIEGRSVRKTTLITISLVHQILTNKLLTGAKNLNKGSSYERQYPQIITEEQFERCLKIAETNNKKLPKSSAYIHYGSGIIKCAECGRNFVSSGYKNYYHCRDAYNYYRDYETTKSGGTPICKNKLCINCNVMDSLLWELAGDYESTFIFYQAKEKLSQYEQERVVTQQKIAAIPKQLSDIQNKRERNGSAYVDGSISLKKYKEYNAAFDKEERNLKKQEVHFKERLTEIDADIDYLKHSINAATNPSTGEELELMAENLINIRERIAAITDDEERRKIVQRQITKVVVEHVTIPYKFKSYPEKKEVSAKKIYIESRYQSNDTIYYLPNTGKGGIYLKKNAEGEFDEFYLTQYLIRRVDKSKVARMERIKREKEDKKNKVLADLERLGYYSIRFIMQETHLCYSALYKAIQAGKLKAKKVEGTWYAKGKDIDEYIKKYNPQPQPKKNEQNLSPEEKLLKDVLSL